MDGEAAHSSELNTDTDTWTWIASYCKDRIHKLRVQNDSPAKSELQTANIRGRISMCKEILGLAENKKVDVEPPKREIY